MTSVVGDFVQHEYPAAAPFDATSEIVDRLVREGFMVVEDTARFFGILIPTDVLTRPHKLVVDCVTPKPVVDHRARVGQTLSMMEDHHLAAVAVFRKGRFQGVVSRFDLTAGARSADTTHKTRGLHEDENRLLSMATAGAAHDFRNILMGLQYYVSAIQPESLTDDGHDFCEMLGQWLQRACDLADQLAKYTAAGTTVSDFVDIRSAIRETVSFFLAGAGVAATFRLSPDLRRPRIPLRPFSRIIANLVANAREAMPDGGALEVTAENADLAAHPVPAAVPAGSTCIRLELADSGKGVPPELIDRIFDPGFTTKPGGTGLGLSVVRSLLEQHGGWITAAPRRPRGTIFNLYFPA